jgi:hypothetical protein
MKGNCMKTFARCVYLTSHAKKYRERKRNQKRTEKITFIHAPKLWK